jgi:alkylation response protein AidB-like acyl-CoA dehydrogenase
MNAGSASALLDSMRAVLGAVDPATPAAALLQQLAQCGLDRLPLPGSGATLDRWRALALVAGHDLSLAKLYEGHTDALAILHELGAPDGAAPNETTWGMWAAEAPEGRTVIEPAANGNVLLRGAKCWCSGAATASHALLTAWYPDGRGPQLVALRLRQPGVDVSRASWRAVGMAGSASFDVSFRGAEGRLVGDVGAYLARPGFWQGGAGIAACWYGGARVLATTLRQALANVPEAARSPFRLAALGHIDIELHGTAGLLREAALWIDEHPRSDAGEAALRVRLAAEATAKKVLDGAGCALGAAAFCRDARFAQVAADLPVFIRQSHAERDFASLGSRLLGANESAWTL